MQEVIKDLSSTNRETGLVSVIFQGIGKDDISYGWRESSLAWWFNSSGGRIPKSDSCTAER